MENKAIVRMADVFISWTGTDAEWKGQIAARLRDRGMEVLLSDEQCQGDFVLWSESAATAAHVFLPVITEAALQSRGMEWELRALDEKLRSEEGEVWRDSVLPVCTSLAVYETYKSRFSAESQALLANISAVTVGETLTDSDLEILADKASERITARFSRLYRENMRSDHIKLIPLYAGQNGTRSYRFRDLYVQRRITEIDANEAEVGVFDTPNELLNGDGIPFLYGAAGAGKTQYINEIRECASEDQLVLTLSCADVARDGRDLFPILFEEFHRVCGQRRFYTENDFKALLRTARQVLVFDGLDEITTGDATDAFLLKIGKYYESNRDTRLIFTGRNEADGNRLAFGGESVRRFRLNKLTEDEIESLGGNLFLLFGAEAKGKEFYVRVKDLNDEIRSNPLLLSQLAIVYNDSGKIPETVVGILDAVSEITLRADKVTHNLQAIPPEYETMVRRDIGDILKRFSREKYVKASEGKDIEFSRIVNRVLREKYGEDKSACRERTGFLLDYLRNRAIFADGKFYHKMFLEYFTAVSYYEEAFDGDYGEIEDTAPIAELLRHYRDPYWSEVIKLFLIKADSAIDGGTTEELYETILTVTAVREYTLLLDTCRDLIRNRVAAETVLARDLLQRSVGGEYPPYGPLFWYVPKYELYKAVLRAAERLQNAKAAALVRDVCFLFGGTYTAKDVDTEINGEALFRSVESKLTGIRRGLCELFYMGKTEATDGENVYPRCFNLAEARSFAESGYGTFRRMTEPFGDELGLYEHESYNELDGEYIGFISCPYDKEKMEATLNGKPARICALALTPTENTTLEYVAFHRAAIECIYIPENIDQIKENAFLFMCPSTPPKRMDDVICYIPLSVKKLVIPEGIRRLDYEYDDDRLDSYDGYFRSMTQTPDSLTLSAYRCLEEIRLPDTVDTLPERVFAFCESLSRVTLPPTLTCIEPFAFGFCRRLTEIDLPASLRTLGHGAFVHCDSLRRMVLPAFLQVIDGNGFADCTALAEVVFSDSPRGGVEAIGDGMFENCTSLTSVRLPRGLKTVGWNAFSGCTSLKELTLPDTVTEIVSHAFSGCTSLTKIHLPESLTEMGSGLFLGASALREIEIPDGVTTLCDSLFSACEGLTRVRLPRYLEKLGGRVFQNCTALSEIEMPDTVTEMGKSVFKGCRSLKSIRLPPRLAALPRHTFEGCTALKQVYLPRHLCRRVRFLPSGVEALCLETGEPFDAALLREEALNVAEGTAFLAPYAYKDAAYEQVSLPFTLLEIGDRAFDGCDRLRLIRLPETLGIIGEGAFADCTALPSIHLPEKLSSLGEKAFLGCKSLTEIDLPDTLEVMPDSVLDGCESLTSVTLPKGLKRIGIRAMSGCAALTTVVLPDSLTEIDWEAFSGCTGLTRIHLPPKLHALGGYAFKDCTALLEIELPDLLTEEALARLEAYHLRQREQEEAPIVWDFTASETEEDEEDFPEYMMHIGYSVFENCVSLKRVHLPRGLMAVHWRAFADCVSLTDINLPDSLLTVGTEAFSGCAALTELTLPDSLCRIEDGAFKDCRSLRSLRLPRHVTKIYRAAFADCRALASLEFCGEVTEIEDDAFRGCASLTELRIPTSVLEIGDNAFGGCTALAHVEISANFRRDITRIFGDLDPKIITFI